MTVRYEWLVGEKGGGSEEQKIETIRAIGAYIGLPLSEQEIEDVSQQLFDKTSRTFRSSSINSWQKLWSPEIDTYFRQRVGEDILRLMLDENDNKKMEAET